MANANYTPIAVGTVLTGTSGDDIISINPTGALGAVTINAGAGTDTIIFDGELAAASGAGVLSATGINVFDYNAGPGVFTVGAYEFLTFDNGTVSAGASVTPEQILADSISATISGLGEDATGVAGGGGAPDFDLSNLLDWNGSAAATNAGWTIQSIEGQASSAGAFISIVEDGEVQGRVEVLAGNAGIDVTAENAFHTSITEIGAIKTMEIDVVLEKLATGATFTETLTVDVVGVASGADNLFNGAATADGGYAAGAITSAIDGLGGNDLMTGNDGDDVLFGNDGDDRLWAGLTDTGDDVSIGGAGNDKVGGGAGNDWLIGDGHVGTSTFAAATDGADDLFGADGDDFVIGGTFTDAGDVTAYDSTTPLLTVAAATGVVTLAATSVTGTAGDKLWAGAGNDQVVGAGGDDRIGLGDGNDIAMGQGGDDEIFAGAGNDSVDGGAGDDTIYGGAGNDSILGAAGADTIIGGTGDDRLFGGGVDGAVDTFVFEVGDGSDTIFGFDQTVGSRDVVDLSALGITSLSDLVTVDDGTDFIVFYGESDSIKFDAMSGAITDADFLFA